MWCFYTGKNAESHTQFIANHLYYMLFIVISKNFGTINIWDDFHNLLSLSNTKITFDIKYVFICIIYNILLLITNTLNIVSYPNSMLSILSRLLEQFQHNPTELWKLSSFTSFRIIYYYTFSFNPNMTLKSIWSVIIFISIYILQSV